MSKYEFDRLVQMAQRLQNEIAAGRNYTHVFRGDMRAVIAAVTHIEKYAPIKTRRYRQKREAKAGENA